MREMTTQESRDEYARALCSDQALADLAALPALLRHIALKELHQDEIDAVGNANRAAQLLAEFDMSGEFPADEAERLIRREYLARKCVEAFQAEIAFRQCENGAGIH